MRFSIPREQLLTPLQAVVNVVEKRQTMPILSNVLISATDQGITVTGTDLEVEIVASTQHAVEQTGELTVSARKLVDIIRALPDSSSIDLAYENNKLQIRSGRSKFNLTTLPAHDFPKLEDFVSDTQLSIPGQDFKKLLDRTAFSMAMQDVRYYLNGLLLEVRPERLRCVGTDGHRLSLSTLEVDNGDAKPKQVILPRKAVIGLQKLLPDNESLTAIQLTDNHVRVVFGEIQFTAKLIDGRFPDYEKVIPTYSEDLVVADRSTVLSSLSRTSILANEKYRGVFLKFETDRLWFKAHNPEQEDAEEEVSVNYQGKNIEIGFNSGYLKDAINAIDTDDFVMSVTDNDKSCIIKKVDSEDCVYVVMPMRL